MDNSLAIGGLTWLQRVVAAYVVLALGTVAAMVVMQLASPGLATQEAWGHAVIVGAFSILLLFRMRSARKGEAAGVRAVMVIGGVLCVVNLVEAMFAGAFPLWMRVEMLVIAALMLLVVALAVRVQRSR